MADLSPGAERAIIRIGEEMPRLVRELEKLNKTLAAPAEVKNSMVEALKSFRQNLVETFDEAKSKVEKSVQE
jgi:hypothetical protein